MVNSSLEWMIIIWLQVIDVKFGLFLTQKYNVASEDFEYDDV